MVAAARALILGLAVVAGATAAEPPNLARQATARTWLPTSGPTPGAEPARANDGDPLTFWTSLAPTVDPPKDLGLEWPAPVTIGCLVVRFSGLGYLPAADGWRVEARRGEGWEPVAVRAEHTASEWWTLHFPPLTTTAVRLVITAYQRTRPSIAELEAYRVAPAPSYRRPPTLDGGFCSFHFEGWARFFPTDAALAEQLVAAQSAGLGTILLYTTDRGDGLPRTVVPGTVLEQLPWWHGRDPLEAWLTTADRLGLEVWVGDTWPSGYPSSQRPAAAADVATRLTTYREQLLRRYGGHPSLVGYYLDHECNPASYGNDPRQPAAEAEALARQVKRLLPRLRVIQPVGLYRWQEQPADRPRHVLPAELRRFWAPYLAACPSVDIALVIDGVGTGLATLATTDLAQACLRELCDRAGKELWVDVEGADFGTYQSMTWDRFEPSLQVAARHADRIVVFDYLNYLCPGNGREGSRRLYEDLLRHRPPAP